MTANLESLTSLARLDGHAVTVTGAAQGFGRAIAARLVEAGAHVHLVDRNADAVLAAAAELTAQADQQAHPGKATGHIVDITDDSRVAAYFAELADHRGPIGLVNNAGVFSNLLVKTMARAEFERVLRVNVVGTFLMCQQFAASHRPGQTASIVNIASVDAVAASAPGLSHYTTSKHAVAGLTKSLAMELAPSGIRVNAVCPGASMTEGAQALIAEGTANGIDVSNQWAGIAARTPLGRLVEPDDVARATHFLISALAASVTGALLPVDAGILVQPLEGYVG